MIQMSGCPSCDQLKKAALEASALFHNLQRDLEKAAISGDWDSSSKIRAKLELARYARDNAIGALTNHKHIHTENAIQLAFEPLQ